MASRGRTAPIAIAVVSALVFGGLALAISASAENAGTYESTQSLTGEELAEALGLKAIPIAPGEEVSIDDPRLQDCAGGQPEATVLVRTASGVYCTADVAENEFEARDLASRLVGHILSDLEKQVILLEEQGDALYEAGKTAEAIEAWSKAHDLVLQEEG